MIRKCEVYTMEININRTLADFLQACVDGRLDRAKIYANALATKDKISYEEELYKLALATMKMLKEDESVKIRRVIWLLCYEVLPNG